MEGINISLEPTPQARTSKFQGSKRGSKTKSSVKLTLEQRIKIEQTFFKINYYFGGTLDTEIEKVIPDLIKQFKSKEDMDMSGMSDMGDLAGAVGLIRMCTRSIWGHGECSLKVIRGIWKDSSIRENLVGKRVKSNGKIKPVILSCWRLRLSWIRSYCLRFRNIIWRSRFKWGLWRELDSWKRSLSKLKKGLFLEMKRKMFRVEMSRNFGLL